MEKHSRTRLADGEKTGHRKLKKTIETDERESSPVAPEDASQDDDPVMLEPITMCCPKCGSGDHYVRRSRPVGEKRRRIRCCRNCGKQFETLEEIT